MKKVVSGLFMALDSVVESHDEWQFDSFDGDMGAEVDTLIAETDTILLGRTTYDEWTSYWPATTEDLDFASYINDAPKYVVSTTLEEPLEWRNSTLIKGDVAEAIGELTSQPGRDIAVQGSPTLVRSLLQNNLLDKLKLMIHPVVGVESVSSRTVASRKDFCSRLHDLVLQDLSGTLQSLRLTQLQSKDSGIGLELAEELEALRRAIAGLRGAIHDLRHEK